MIYIIIIIKISILFCNSKIDSINIKSFDFSKKINIKSIIPKDFPTGKEIHLNIGQIEKIKEKSKNFEPDPILDNDIIIMETTKGIIKLKFYPEVAPKHCYNFKKLANSGFYDGTSFHRIIPGFMIQGGDINSLDGDPKNDGRGGPGWTVDAEFSNISHKRGILSMARSSDPNSAGSQFFICVADAPHLDGKYTVFGEVIENINVIDSIVKTPTNYMEVKRRSRDSIPKGEDPNNWITILDYKTGKKLYSKVPKFMNKADFEYEMKNKIRSDMPAFPLKMNKVRVISLDLDNN